MDLMESQQNINLIEDSYTDYLESIGEAVVREAKWTSKGVYWDFGCNPHNLSIQYGQSGILLFLTELTTVSRESKYNGLLEDSCSWIRENLLRNRQDSGFFGGELGILSALSRANKLLNDSSIQEVIVNRVSNISTRRCSSLGLIDGIAGNLLAVVWLKNAIDLNSLEKLVQFQIDALLGCCKHFKEGIFWDTSAGIGDGLSFLSGNLGIYYALGKVYDVFGDPDLKKILERLKIFLQEYCEKYFKQISFLDQSYFLYQVAKVPLSREKEILIRQRSWFRRQTHISQVRSNSLLSGRSAKGLCYLEEYRVSGNKEYLEAAGKLVSIMLNEWKETGKYSVDLKYRYLSFFNGITGIGYFVCKTLEASKMNFIDQRGQTESKSRFKFVIKDQLSINEDILRSLELNTNRVKGKSNGLAHVSFEDLEQDKEDFEYFIRHCEEYIRRASAFADFRSVKAQKHYFLNVANRSEKMRSKLGLNPHAIILSKEDQGSILILDTSSGIKRHMLSDLVLQILETIVSRSVLKDQIKDFSKKVQTENEISSQDSKTVTDFYMDQIRELINSEVVFAKNKPKVNSL